MRKVAQRIVVEVAAALPVAVRVHWHDISHSLVVINPDCSRTFCAQAAVTHIKSFYNLEVI